MAYVLKERSPRLYLFLFVIVFVFTKKTCFAQTEYLFDDSLFKGWGSTQGNLSRFNDIEQRDAGLYDVDIYINGRREGRSSVDFQINPQTSNLEPCFTAEQLEQDLLSKWDGNAFPTSTGCYFITQSLPGATYHFQIDRLILRLNIPQALLSNEIRGYIDPLSWDAGESALFANYDANWYRSQYRNGGHNQYDYAYTSLNSGFNFGLWRLRHHSNYSYSKFGNQTRSKWNNIRTYAQRSIPQWRSELTLGESFTSGQLLGSVRYRGVSIKSDERMLAPSQRSYAPEVRGTALTSARVIIRQHGQIIREMNVAPGPFIINDLYDTSYNGDLNVEVVEADGTSSEFTVPFAAVPESIRPGLSRYSATIGQITQYGKDWFGETTYQRGINNNLTLNFGARAADNYLALLGGGVVAGRWGAFGLNATYSNARAERGERMQGWRLGASYSRTFQPTNTILTLAGYRHSTSGYRDITDVLGVRKAFSDGRRWDSYNYQQRNQFTLMINQNMGKYGALYFSGSASDYYGGKQKDTQFQFGYTNNWKQFSYSLSWSRQKNTYHQTYYDPTLPESVLSGSNNIFRGDVISLNVSFPLGGSPKSPQLNTMYTKRSGDQAGHSVQAGLSGVMGRDNTFSYALAANRDSDYGNTNWNANVQQRGSLATVSAGYAHAHDYKQYSAGVRGALVAHKGGVTLGPYLSETFAVVHAEGAEGAMVRHGQGSRINSSGYAIVPALSAFRYNSIRIDPQGLPSYTELLETEKRVVPYAGAMLYVSFDTRFGQAILVQSELEDGSPIPLGTAVSSEQERDIGVVGQGGQVYARVQEQQGSLILRWGDDDKHVCFIPYDITNEDKAQDLIQLTVACRNISPTLHSPETP